METSTSSNNGVPKKKMLLNFFEMAGTGNHMTIGQWKSPTDNSRTKDRLDYWLWLAKLAEKGKISAIFFADTYAGHDLDMAGSKEAIYRSGSLVAMIDPVTVISAMAAVTKSLCFGVTGSTSYLSPYALARTWGGLDHLTNGRMAWNIVTSYSNAAAKAFGKGDSVLSTDERYASAHEYMEIVYKLWEGSWESGAQVWDAKNNIAYDPSKIHEVVHHGKYYQMSGIQQTHPSPQRTPVLFQAGGSKSGVEFAGKHAEAIFCMDYSITKLRGVVDQVRASASRNGRDPRSLKFFASITPIVGRTLEEAQEKYKTALQYADVAGGLAKFGSFSGVNLSEAPWDEPLDFPNMDGANTVQGFVRQFQSVISDSGQPITPRFIGQSIALGGMAPLPVGTPEMVADVFEKWFVEADLDGFNMSYVKNPESWEDVVELLVPELQKRGLMWDDYTVVGGTFRENLHGKPGEPFIPSHHPGSVFKWDAPKQEKTSGLHVVEEFKNNSP